MSNIVSRYLEETGASLDSLSSEQIAYLAALERVAQESPSTALSILQELGDQRSNVKLIASENYCSTAVQFAMGNFLTDKYAEGAPGKRFYAGCDNVDAIEDHARESAKKLFGVDHAYVQPHSGADANLVAFLAVLHHRIGRPVLDRLGAKNLLDLDETQWATLRQSFGAQRLLGMDLAAGGHLTHGYRLNISAVLFDVTLYGVDPQTGLIDYDEVASLARECRPLVLLVGYSAYPRAIDFARMREIADEVGAVVVADMAHFAGLVAGGVFTGTASPIGYSDIITSTTHKTLRGPRGGLVLCREEFATDVDKGCPYILGGPLPNVMAAKAVCFEEALRPDFAIYAKKIVENARALAEELVAHGIAVVSGGTDNHLVLADVRPYDLTGRQAESALRSCGITLNRNVIPGDTNGPWYTSGLRLGTAAVTTLGMGSDDMRSIARMVVRVLQGTRPVPTSSNNTRVQFSTEPTVERDVRAEVGVLLDRYPLYPEIDLGFLQREVGAALALQT